MKKRIITLCMAVVLLFAMLPQIALTANAAEVVESGNCGDNLTWTLDDEGTLTISGRGTMDDYSMLESGYTTSPWTYHFTDIEKIQVESGVTYIGQFAFYQTWAKEVVISNTVSEIGDHAFSGCDELTDLSLPDGLLHIGNSAFSGCFSLNSIDIPSSVTYIGGNAFSTCLNLTTVYIPGSVTEIGTGAFSNGEKLELINVSSENRYYCSDDYGVLYNKDMTHLLQVPCWVKEDYQIPDSVTTIGTYSFINNATLPSIVIPKNVESIEALGLYGAFVEGVQVDAQNTHYSVDNRGVLYTKNMDTLIVAPVYLSGDYYIPQTVTTIMPHAFWGCDQIKRLVIPQGVTTIGSSAFAFSDLSDGRIEVYFTGDAPIDLSPLSDGISFPIFYYPVDNVTWTDAVKEKVGPYVKWEAIEMPNFYGYSLNKDGWSFANASQSFAEEPASHADDYFIPRERYDALFGSSYVDSTEGLYTEEWGGNCAGMSATAILFFLDKLDWESIDAAYTEDFANPNDFYRTVNLDQKSQSYYPAIGNDTELTRLIEAYQLYINAINRSRLVENLKNTYFAAEPEIGTLQGVTAENEPIVTTNYTYRHIPASEGGTYIASMLEEFQEAYDENKPLLIALHGDDFGHGVVARTDLKPEDMGDGWWRVYVYDPNKPYINESVTSTVSGVEAEPKYAFGCNTIVDNGGDIYLELNPSLNQWRYCTSVNSNNPDSYIGSTESGELLWNGVYAENENNEQYHIMRPDYFYTIDLANFTMEDYANPHFDSTSAWIPENELAVAVDGDTDCTIYDSAGELVAIVEDGDAFVLSATGGFSSYIGQSEDAGSLGGRLYLPVDVYTVHYSSGNVQFFGSSNVLSFSCEGAAEFTVDITLNSLQIVAQEDGIAAVKCANVTSTDECSYVDTEGALVAGETFTIAYSDENEVEASTDSKDGEFQLYQKNANQEEASPTKVIKANSLWWLWIVGGVIVAGTFVLLVFKRKKK